jgi:hypothetical protein
MSQLYGINGIDPMFGVASIVLLSSEETCSPKKFNRLCWNIHNYGNKRRVGDIKSLSIKEIADYLKTIGYELIYGAFEIPLERKKETLNELGKSLKKYKDQKLITCEMPCII